MTTSPAATETPLHRLTEHVGDWTSDVLIDRDSRTIKRVALAGADSKNGYRYSADALKAAVPLYVNKPVFLDHATAASRPYDRSTRDLAGSVINPRFEDGRLRGDIRVLDTDAGRTLLALAECNGPAVGMSHVILAQRNAAGTLVEKVHDVISVDAVVFPASTTSFSEQHLPDPQSELTAEREELRKEIAKLKTELIARRAEREVAHLLAESRLPDAAVTEVFRQQLLSTSPEQRSVLIQDRLALLQRNPTVTSTPRNENTQTISNEQFLAAVKQ